jgi:hypothetical protein
MERKTKQPREVLDFDFNGDRALGSIDTISNVTVSCEGPDQSLVVENVSWDDTVGKVWLSGGTDGATYKVTGLVFTAAGREIEDEFLLTVKAK